MPTIRADLLLIRMAGCRVVSRVSGIVFKVDTTTIRDGIGRPLFDKSRVLGLVFVCDGDGNVVEKLQNDGDKVCLFLRGKTDKEADSAVFVTTMTRV